MMPSFIIKKWGEMMKTQVLNEEGLSTYDQEIKDYIKSQGMGVTLEEVQALIDSSEEKIFSAEFPKNPSDDYIFNQKAKQLSAL